MWRPGRIHPNPTGVRNWEDNRRIKKVRISRYGGEVSAEDPSYAYYVNNDLSMVCSCIAYVCLLGRVWVCTLRYHFHECMNVNA